MRRYFTDNKWHLLWLIPILILLLPIFLILIPFIIINDKKRLKEAKAFSVFNHNKLYFIYSNKRRWGDFITNNVIPVLPKETIIVNVYHDESDVLRKANLIIDRKQYPWSTTRLPLLVKFTESSLLVLSLHDDYKTIVKESVKTNAETQNRIQAQIIAKMNDHSTEAAHKQGELHKK